MKRDVIADHHFCNHSVYENNHIQKHILLENGRNKLENDFNNNNQINKKI